jgi:hypothetical protein
MVPACWTVAMVELAGTKAPAVKATESTWPELVAVMTRVLLPLSSCDSESLVTRPCARSLARIGLSISNRDWPGFTASPTFTYCFVMVPE